MAPGIDRDLTIQPTTSPQADHPHHFKHLVQFYETDDFLLNTLSSFIGAGLGAGEACIIIATPAHRAGLEQRLKENGVDPSRAQEQGRYFVLDADETLAQFLDGEALVPERFFQLTGSLIERAAEGEHTVRIFGEMVALLWKAGKREAAINLEELWNHLFTLIPPCTLLCAYEMHDFAGEAYGKQFSEICLQHSQTLPDENYALLETPDDRLRVITLLQQKAASLEAEMAERKGAEERLRISENRYRRLFETSTEGIVLVDPQTCLITDANPSALKFLGYTSEQLPGQPLWSIGLFGDQAATLSTLQKLQEHRMLHYETMPLCTKSGEARSVELVCTLFQANGHEVIQCNLHDITARVRADEALRESEERFRRLARQAPIMIWQSDPTGSMIYANAAWYFFTGLSEQESLPAGWTGTIHPQEQETALAGWKAALSTRTPYHSQLRLRSADGNYRHVQIEGTICTDAMGEFTGYIGTIVDLTEYKDLEQQREAFTSLVTHELRTPLTALQGNVQLAQRWLTRLLSQEQLGEREQHTLEEVLTMLGRSQQQLRVQNRLINDLLDVSRIQEDKLELYFAPCDLLGLVYETVQDYQAAYPSRLITLTLPEQDLLPVYADGDRLRQVLSNYLTNALKFSPDGMPVEVEVTLLENSIRVFVTDHGPGLSSEQQQHIWKRLDQGPRTPLQRGAKVGLGLGLYICRQLMDRQQGQVGVESSEGNGATFWFALPLLSSLSCLPVEKQ